MTAPYEKAKLLGYDVQPDEDSLEGGFLALGPDRDTLEGRALHKTEHDAWEACDNHRLYGRVFAHTPDRCPSKHHNGGDDVCTDCGEDLNGSGFQPVTERRVCVLSTLHLTEAATLAMLELPCERWICTGGRLSHGFYLYAHRATSEGLITHHPDLARIYAWAKARGFDYVQLDQDEDPRDDLESITEERLAEIAPPPGGVFVIPTLSPEMLERIKAGMNKFHGGGLMIPSDPDKVWVVEGEHFNVPGRVVETYRSEASANQAAADLVNMLVDHVNDIAGADSDVRTVPERATPQNWTAILKMAQFAEWASDTPKEELDPDYDYEGRSEGWVSITAHEVKG